MLLWNFKRHEIILLFSRDPFSLLFLSDYILCPPLHFFTLLFKHLTTVFWLKKCVHLFFYCTHTHTHAYLIMDFGKIIRQSEDMGQLRHKILQRIALFFSFLYNQSAIKIVLKFLEFLKWKWCKISFGDFFWSVVMNLCISNCSVGSMSRKTICKLSCHVSYWELFIRWTSIKIFSSDQDIVTHWNIYMFLTWSILSRNSYLVEEKNGHHEGTS